MAWMLMFMACLEAEWLVPDQLVDIHKTGIRASAETGNAILQGSESP